jgi:spore coat polysaccharide biosynthesis predicted glycosyltransferase SpsG
MTLGQELQKQGAKVHFVVREDPISLRILAGEGCDAVPVGDEDEHGLHQTLRNVERSGAQAVVIDSYRIKGLSAVRSPHTMITAIDDLAEAAWLSEVDLIVNGAVNAAQLPYPADVKKLLGPQYLLLREEFSGRTDHQVREVVERVMISVGGADPMGITATLMACVRTAVPQAWIDVVIGPFFSVEVKAKVRRLAEHDDKVILHVEPVTLRPLMLACDLAISGGGQTACELVATGTPALALDLAIEHRNQDQHLKGLQASGTLASARADDSEEKLTVLLKNLAGDRQKRADMSRAGHQLVDGLGAKRVARTILEACSR